MLTNFSVRITLPRRILSLTNICVRIITYDFFLYELLSRRFFVNMNILHTYFIPYEHLYMNFSVRTFTYIYLSDEHYPWRTFAYEHLHTNFFQTNFIYTKFCPDELLSLRIFYIRTLYHTNFSVRTLAYELLRTYFSHANFIPYEHLLTNNCVRTLCIRTISIRTLVLQPVWLASPFYCAVFSTTDWWLLFLYSTQH